MIEGTYAEMDVAVDLAGRAVQADIALQACWAHARAATGPSSHRPEPLCTLQATTKQCAPDVLQALHALRQAGRRARSQRAAGGWQHAAAGPCQQLAGVGARPLDRPHYRLQLQPTPQCAPNTTVSTGPCWSVGRA